MSETDAIEMMSGLIGDSEEIATNNESVDIDNVTETENVSVATINNLNNVEYVSVSDVIKNNADKHINMLMLNDMVATTGVECDLVNYIVYINSKKNIPCIFDCEKLVVPKTSVMKNDGTYAIKTIEGRRSGFVIVMEDASEGTTETCYNRHLVMSKNFIYDIVFGATGNVESVHEYNRKHECTPITADPLITDFDSASLAVRNVLPKIVRNGKCTTIEQLREEVRKSYNSVDDVNALFKIVQLMLTIGA